MAVQRLCDIVIVNVNLQFVYFERVVRRWYRFVPPYGADAAIASLTPFTFENMSPGENSK